MRAFFAVALTCALLVLAAAPATAQPPAPPWGACGRGTAPEKVVRLFTVNRTTDFVLRCGGPLYSPEPTWGYRHILAGHRHQFETLAVGTGQNWRDIVDLSISHNATDPDRVVPAGGGKTCRSRLIYFINKRTNQVHNTAIVRLITNEANDIITAYPSTHCRQDTPELR